MFPANIPSIFMLLKSGSLPLFIEFVLSGQHYREYQRNIRHGSCLLEVSNIMRKTTHIQNKI